MLEENERIDDLQYKGLRIIQNPQVFCFGTDAVLLSSFVQIKKNEKVADFCTGTGIIPILLSGRGQANHITGIEIQQEMADMAQRSVALNGLQDVITIIAGDIRSAYSLIGGVFDVVTVNPPYEKAGNGALSRTEGERIARHEVLCNLEDIAFNASKVLKTGGRLYMIHRTSRLTELMLTMTLHQLEPKRLRFVYPNVHEVSRYILMECKKNANRGLIIEKPLVIYDENKEYTPELKEIYHLC